MTPEAMLVKQLEEHADILLDKQISDSVKLHLEEFMNRHVADETKQLEDIHEALKTVKTDLEVLMTLFQQSKAVITVVKWVGYACAGGWALTIWAKDHIKL